MYVSMDDGGDHVGRLGRGGMLVPQTDSSDTWRVQTELVDGFFPIAGDQLPPRPPPLSNRSTGAHVSKSRTRI
jgi:hypothetical protein